MKTIQKFLSILLSTIIILSIITACSAQAPKDSMSEMATSKPDIGYESQSKESSGESNSPLQPEKVITIIDMRIETVDFDDSISRLDQIADKHKAYIEYSNMSYGSKNFKNGDYTIRVPKDNLLIFKSDLDELGNKVWESTNKQDVTKSYTDTESRLRVIETKESRILALMEKASKIEDIIVLENQLSEIIYEKESLQSNLMDLDDRIDYSTLNLYIKEVDKLTGSTSPTTSFSNKLSDAINDSIYFFKNSIELLVILLVYLIPFIIVLGGVAFAVYRGIRKFRKNKRHRDGLK